MGTYYLIRLDDACPTMNRDKWARIESILDKYSIKPMVGIVPDCKDESLMIDNPSPDFWAKALKWHKKGWTIALHGYNHCYSSDDGKKGLNPMWTRSEFAGLPLIEQREKIREGVAIIREQGINPKYFFAPSHTFDENTLTALREESDIRIISDTIAIRPYRYKDFVFVPQFSGQCRKIKMKGLFTFCLHPNTMNDEAFRRTDRFFQEHWEKFISFNDVDFERVGKKNCFDKFLSWGYFTIRNLKK